MHILRTSCYILYFFKIICFFNFNSLTKYFIYIRPRNILYECIRMMYHTPLNNTRFSIDAYNALIASIYLHQCFYIVKILAHSVDFNELYRNVTIHCPSFSLVR